MKNKCLLIMGVMLPLLLGEGCFMDILQSEISNSQTQVKFTTYSVKNPLAEVTHISVVFPFSASTDPTEKQGLTTIAVDMLLKGSREFNSRQISERLALYGASVQMIVGRFYTVLQINVLSEYLEPCLKFLTVLMRTPTFPKSEFQLLKDQYISDIKTTLESNKKMLWRAYQRWYYAAEPLNHLTGGTLQTLNAITLEDVRAWWKNSFGASELKVFISSNLPEPDVVGLLQRYFSWVKPVPTPPSPTAQMVYQPKGIEVVLVDKKDTQTNDFMFAQPSMSFAVDKQQYYANYLANTAFGSGMQSRLFVELREKRGWTYHASSGYWSSFYWDIPVPWVIYSFPSLQYTAQAIPMAYQMLKDYLAKGLTSEEIQLYRTNMIRSYPFTVDTPHKLLDKIFDEVVQGRYKLDQKEREALLLGITHSKILSSLKNGHTTQDLVFLVVGDAQKIQPQLSKWFKSIPKVRVIRPEDVL